MGRGLEECSKIQKNIKAERADTNNGKVKKEIRVWLWEKSGGWGDSQEKQTPSQPQTLHLQW